jgi:hypothetical protein
MLNINVIRVDCTVVKLATYKSYSWEKALSSEKRGRHQENTVATLADRAECLVVRRGQHNGITTSFLKTVGFLRNPL